MKRVWLLGATLLSSMALGGCPLYPDEPAYCDYDSDCGSGFFCNGYGECVPDGKNDVECTTPSQCGVNETCGADRQCHPGDCSFVGCPAGYSCVRDGSQRFSCEDTLNGSAGSSSGGATAGGTSWRRL